MAQSNVASLPGADPDTTTVAMMPAQVDEFGAGIPSAVIGQARPLPSNILPRRALEKQQLIDPNVTSIFYNRATQLVLYSNGVCETLDPNNPFYGYSSRLGERDFTNFVEVNTGPVESDPETNDGGFDNNNNCGDEKPKSRDDKERNEGEVDQEMNGGNVENEMNEGSDKINSQDPLEPKKKKLFGYGEWIARLKRKWKRKRWRNKIKKMRERNCRRMKQKL